MKTKRLVCLVAAASLGFGSLSAFAQDHHRGDRDRGDNRGWSQQQAPQRAMGNRGDRDREYNREYNRDHDPGTAATTRPTTTARAAPSGTAEAACRRSTAATSTW